jgi:predicted nucleic acid-binding protein
LYVIDSSVALKWLLDEEDSDRAQALCERCIAGTASMVAPDILLYEVVNILLRKRRLPIAEATAGVQIIFGTGIRLRVPDQRLMIRAAEIADETGASAYDASYVALAQEENAPFVTADARLVKLCRSVAEVRLLRDI